MISKKITIIDVIIGILELEQNTQLTVKELKEEFENTGWMVSPIKTSG